MMQDARPRLCEQTFASYQWHLLEASALYIRPEIVTLLDGTRNAFNLTTATHSDVADREIEIMRAETSGAKAPLWLALPAQILACIAYALFVLTLCAGFVLLGAVYVAAEGTAAIVRGLRWALCSE